MRVKQISNLLLYFRQYSRVIASRDAKLTTIAKASPFKPFDLLQVNVIKLTVMVIIVNTKAHSEMAVQ